MSLKRSYKFIRIFFLLVFIFLHNQAFAQNVGIGITEPNEKLHVDGAINIASTTNENEGTIQYKEGSFQGRNGSEWKKLDETVPSGSIIMRTSVDSTLLQLGYSYYGESTQNISNLSVPVECWEEGASITEYLIYGVVGTKGDSLYCWGYQLSTNRFEVYIYNIQNHQWIVGDSRTYVSVEKAVMNENSIAFWCKDINLNPRLLIYDIQQNDLVTATPTGMPSERDHIAFSIEDNNVFVFGGKYGSFFDDFYTYNIGNNSWLNLSSNSVFANKDPEDYEDYVFQDDDGLIIYCNSATPSLHKYFFGLKIWKNYSMNNGPGQIFPNIDFNGNEVVVYGFGTSESEGFYYNLSSGGNWNAFQDIPIPMDTVQFNHHFLVENELYLLGATNTSDNSPYDKDYTLNLSTNNWTILPTANRPTINGAGGLQFSIGDKLFVHNTFNSDFTDLTGEGYYYDIGKEIWGPMKEIEERKLVLYNDSHIFNTSNGVVLFNPVDFSLSSDSNRLFYYSEECSQGLFTYHLYIKD